MRVKWNRSLDGGIQRHRPEDFQPQEFEVIPTNITEDVPPGASAAAKKSVPSLPNHGAGFLGLFRIKKHGSRKNDDGQSLCSVSSSIPEKFERRVSLPARLRRRPPTANEPSNSAESERRNSVECPRDLPSSVVTCRLDSSGGRDGLPKNSTPSIQSNTLNGDRHDDLDLLAAQKTILTKSPSLSECQSRRTEDTSRTFPNFSQSIKSLAPPVDSAAEKHNLFDTAKSFFSSRAKSINKKISSGQGSARSTLKRSVSVSDGGSTGSRTNPSSSLPRIPDIGPSHGSRSASKVVHKVNEFFSRLRFSNHSSNSPSSAGSVVDVAPERVPSSVCEIDASTIGVSDRDAAVTVSANSTLETDSMALFSQNHKITFPYPKLEFYHAGTNPPDPSKKLVNTPLEEYDNVTAFPFAVCSALTNYDGILKNKTAPDNSKGVYLTVRDQSPILEIADDEEKDFVDPKSNLGNQDAENEFCTFSVAAFPDIRSAATPTFESPINLSSDVPVSLSQTSDYANSGCVTSKEDKQQVEPVANHCNKSVDSTCPSQCLSRDSGNETDSLQVFLENSKSFCSLDSSESLHSDETRVTKKDDFEEVEKTILRDLETLMECRFDHTFVEQNKLFVNNMKNLNEVDKHDGKLFPESQNIETNKTLEMLDINENIRNLERCFDNGSFLLDGEPDGKSYPSYESDWKQPIIPNEEEPPMKPQDRDFSKSNNTVTNIVTHQTSSLPSNAISLDGEKHDISVDSHSPPHGEYRVLLTTCEQTLRETTALSDSHRLTNCDELLTSTKNCERNHAIVDLDLAGSIATERVCSSDTPDCQEVDGNLETGRGELDNESVFFHDECASERRGQLKSACIVSLLTPQCVVAPSGGQPPRLADGGVIAFDCADESLTNEVTKCNDQSASFEHQGNTSIWLDSDGHENCTVSQTPMVEFSATNLENHPTDFAFKDCQLIVEDGKELKEPTHEDNGDTSTVLGTFNENKDDSPPLMIVNDNKVSHDIDNSTLPVLCDSSTGAIVVSLPIIEINGNNSVGECVSPAIYANTSCSKPPSEGSSSDIAVANNTISFMHEVTPSSVCSVTSSESINLCEIMVKCELSDKSKDTLDGVSSIPSKLPNAAAFNVRKKKLDAKREKEQDCGENTALSHDVKPVGRLIRSNTVVLDTVTTREIRPKSPLQQESRVEDKIKTAKAHTKTHHKQAKTSKNNNSKFKIVNKPAVNQNVPKPIVDLLSSSTQLSSFDVQSLNCIPCSKESSRRSLPKCKSDEHLSSNSRHLTEAECKCPLSKAELQKKVPKEVGGGQGSTRGAQLVPSHSRELRDGSSGSIAASVRNQFDADPPVGVRLTPEAIGQVRRSSASSDGARNVGLHKDEIKAKSRIPKKQGSGGRPLVAPRPIRPPMWLSKAELSQEIQHLSTLCEARTKELNRLKMDTRHATTGFDALAVVIRYMTAELNAFKNPTLATDLREAQENLNKGKKDLEYYEKEIGKLNSLHAKEVDAFSEKLTREHEVKLQELIGKHNEQIAMLDEQHQKEARSLTEALRASCEEERQQHQKMLDKLQLELKTQREEMEIFQQHELNDLEEGHLERQKSLMSEIEKLQKQCEDAKVLSLTMEEALQKDTDSKLQWLSAKRLDLQNEVDSLKAVLEIKNNELHSLRKENLEMQKELEELPLAREKIKMLQARAEDLQALMAEKVRLERQLSTEHESMKEIYEREEKINKRLSMENEELIWKLKQATESSLLSTSVPDEHEPDELPEYSDLSSSCPPAVFEEPLSPTKSPKANSRSKPMFFTYMNQEELSARSPQSPKTQYKRIQPHMTSSAKTPSSRSPRRSTDSSPHCSEGTPRKMARQISRNASNRRHREESAESSKLDHPIAAAVANDSLLSSASSENSLFEPCLLEEQREQICARLEILQEQRSSDPSSLHFEEANGETIDPKSYYHMAFPVKEVTPDVDCDDATKRCVPRE